MREMTALDRAATRGHQPSRWLTLVLVVLIGLPLLIAGRIVQVAARDERSVVDAIVVLGASASNGRPGDVLEARLEHALDLYADGVAPLIVTAGGTGAGQPSSEAAAGTAWLVERGVPTDAVLTVGVGEDTLGSLRAVADEAAAGGWSSVVLVTDPWHSYRAQAMATDLGLPGVASSPTTTGPNVTSTRRVVFNIVRETIAFAAYRIEASARRPL